MSAVGTQVFAWLLVEVSALNTLFNIAGPGYYAHYFGWLTRAMQHMWVASRVETVLTADNELFSIPSFRTHLTCMHLE